VQAWIEDRGSGNIGIRLPRRVLGLDVDAYGNKHGGAVLQQMEQHHGELPPSWRSTSRVDGISGIRFYRIRLGLRWPGGLPGIDIIRYAHRYAVAWPSVHPDTGKTYRWIRPDGSDAEPGEVPNVEDLPWLPDPWVDNLTRGEKADDQPRANVTHTQAAAWLQQRGQGVPCKRLLDKLDKGLAGLRSGSSRHDTALSLTNDLVWLAGDGHPGVLAALDTAEAAFYDAVQVDRSRPKDDGEWSRMVAGAVALAAEKHSGDIPPDPCDDPAAAQLAGLIAPGGNHHQGDHHGDHQVDHNDFWEARSELTHLQDFARSRRTAPWAVLGSALVHVVGRVEPSVVLPAGVGSYGSLNLFLGLVGPSGGGKGAAEAAANDALIHTKDLTSVNAGSGEGIAHMYVRRERDRPGQPGQLVQHTTRVLFRAAEVDTLAALKGRQGSTLWPLLRDAWSGGHLGFAYADPSKRLDLRAQSYRMCLIVGIQPGRAAVLLDDADGGTPQRFLWLPVRDHNIPDVKPKTIPGRPWTPPRFDLDPLIGFHVLDVCRTAVRAVDEAAVAQHRGLLDPLDTHAPFARLKTAAALGLLAGRVDVNEEDWQLAGEVMSVSNATRAGVQRTIRLQAKEQSAARGRADGQRAVAAEDVKTEEAVKRVSRSLRSKLNAEWTPGNELRKRLRSTDRSHFEDAIGHLVGAGLVDVEDVEHHSKKGARYRLRQGRP
jgi:hypothetical protein